MIPVFHAPGRLPGKGPAAPEMCKAPSPDLVGPIALRVPFVLPADRLLTCHDLAWLFARTEPHRTRFSYQHWALRLAVFAGFRGRDVAALRCDHLVEEDGAWWFDLRRSYGRGRLRFHRRIPVHPSLLEAGLLALRERRARKPSSPMFPELARNRSAANVVHNWLKRLTTSHWPPRQGPRPTMGDLRMTFLAALLRTAAAPSTVREWAGYPPIAHRSSDPGVLDDDATRIACLRAVLPFEAASTCSPPAIAGDPVVSPA
jgi:hypothetical protein